MSKSCCETHYPRCPYTHVKQSWDYCCIGCDKPGPGSPEHNPSNNACSDCGLLCTPCALVIDILCFIPMVFGYYNVQEP